MLVGQHPGDVGEQPGAVERLDLDAAPGTPTARVGAHSTSTMPLGLAPQRVGVGAVGAVHRDAAAAGDEAEDRRRRAPACSTWPA